MPSGFWIAVFVSAMLSVFAFAIVSKVRSRTPEGRVIWLYRLNLALLLLAMLLVALRLLEAIVANRAIDTALVAIEGVLLPWYGILLLCHLWANRDYFRPRS
ncbi:hypothetical protein VDG1235_1881 [Verrucomicrobiia bacterium DG1235]|nr:hypothetical protein VDG1235_1881 [Verrucomicrobiae bacterium DG1235]